MRRRKGFTITELLVAMALIIFIMYILAEAFSAGAGAFRRLKAIGDMNEKLRTSLGLMRRYLQADHFTGKARMSDPDFWKEGPPREGFFRIYQGSDGTYEGSDIEGSASYRSVDHTLHFAVKLRGNNRGDFFRAQLPQAGSSLLALPQIDTRFQEPGARTYTATWAEVDFALRTNGEVAEDPEQLATLGPQPLHTLYMRNRLCLPDNEILAQFGLPKVGYADYNPTGEYIEFSAQRDIRDPNNLYFNGPADLTMPVRRRGLPNNDPAPFFNMGTLQDTTVLAGRFAPYTYALCEEEPQARLAGNDIVMTNVLSFDVRILLPRDQFNAMIAAYNNPQPPPPQPFPALRPDQQVYDFISLHHPAFVYWMPTTNPTIAGLAAPAPRVFDTWSQAKDDVYDYTLWRSANRPETIPLFVDRSGQYVIRPLAIQITLRIWDANTKQTRQSSIVVDL